MHMEEQEMHTKFSSKTSWVQTILDMSTWSKWSGAGSDFVMKP